MKQSGIYKITNSINGDFYIGSSFNVIGRWYQHRHAAKHLGTYPCKSILYAAMVKYGIDNFLFEMIEECEPTQEMLTACEQYYIDTLRPVYNILQVAYSRLGARHSPETIARMTGRKLSPEHRAAIWANRVILDSTRELQRQAKLGHAQPPEQIEKRMLHIRGVPKTKEHTAKTQEGKRINHNIKVAEKAAANKKDVLIKNDVRHMLRGFSDDQIRYIRQCGKTNTALAQEFNVSPATIRKIRFYRTYKDVPDVAPMEDAA